MFFSNPGLVSEMAPAHPSMVKEPVVADSDVEEDPTAVVGGAPAAAKKKKKAKKKPTATQSTETTTSCAVEVSSGEVKRFDIPEQDNSVFRRVGNWKADPESRQSSPPSVTVRYSPIGEVQEYSNSRRTPEHEAREPLVESDLKEIRQAAEMHRNVRKYAQSFIRPGMTMLDICQRLEKKTFELAGTNADWSNYLDYGYGFPTGCSLNHVAAHYTPNYGDKTVLTANDICKLDFGVHVNGRIVDSAFTIAFDPIFDPLIQATQEGTNAGIKAAGIDARFGEIGAVIQEAIESFEFIDKNGKVIPIKPCKNLNGHSIERYRIHGGQSVPIVKKSDFAHERMQENTCYAIETFATTGKGFVIEDGECSHYMKVWDADDVPLRMKGSKQLLQAIDKQFSTLPFCRRWLDDIGQTRHLLNLKNLVDNGLVQDYPPLVDVKGSFTSQMEHTIFLRPSCKEVVSRGDDY
jgi:methionyl aminopeptidase